MRIVWVFVLSALVLTMPPGAPTIEATTSACIPRPPVLTAVNAPTDQPESFTAIVGTSTNGAVPYNEMRTIRFTRVVGGRVSIMDREERGPFAITLPSSTQKMVMSLRRDPGQRAHVDMVVTDLCGEW